MPTAAPALATAVDTHLFWITSRAAGTLALILASLSVGFGLLMAGKLLKGRGPDLRVVHEALSLATMAALAVHAGALLFDGFIGMSVLDVTVPFVASYHRFWTALGIVGGWAIVLLGLSFYARDRIGRDRWKLLHRFTALGWLAGIGHALGEGTDAGRVWFLASIAIVVLPALALLAVRWTGPRRPRTSQGALRPL
jgi:sulfoxide reductase heme-binding subunit YedZ